MGSGVQDNALFIASEIWRGRRSYVVVRRNIRKLRGASICLVEVSVVDFQVVIVKCGED